MLKYETCTWCGLRVLDIMKHRKSHSKAINFSYEYSKSPVKQEQDLDKHGKDHSTGKLPKGWGRCA